MIALCVAATQPSLMAQWDTAKDKKDASIYLFGSALAGVGTKPLYIVDAKFDLMLRKENKNTGHPCSLLNQAVKFSGTFAANAGGEPPVDRSDIDPDSITAGLLFDCGTPIWPKGGDTGLAHEFRIDGEFSRKVPVSNLVASGRAKWRMDPVPVPGGGIDFEPFAGFETGRNLNHPAVMFKRAVDVSGAGAINRAVYGQKTTIYLFQPTSSISATNIYRFVLEANFTGRNPLSRELYVRSAYVPDAKGVISRQKVVSVDRRFRPSVEVGATYNFTKFLGIKLQYKYGSLPPLFEFVDHQVSIGVTVKAKQK